jgi:hypothetical protein
MSAARDLAWHLVGLSNGSKDDESLLTAELDLVDPTPRWLPKIPDSQMIHIAVRRFVLRGSLSEPLAEAAWRRSEASPAARAQIVSRRERRWRRRGSFCCL